MTMHEPAVKISTGSGVRIAVTGASGFLGRRVVDLLATRSGAPEIAEICALVRRDGWKGGAGTAGAAVPVRRLASVPLHDRAALASALQGCSAVVHCAFDLGTPATNLRMLRALVDVCAAASIRLVHISSAVIYEPLPDGNLDEDCPIAPAAQGYAGTKLALDRELLASLETLPLDAVILRPAIIYGPGGRAWTDTPVRELLAGRLVLPDEGLGLCNAVYVDDVCEAVAASLFAPHASRQSFLISGSSPVTWRNFFSAYERMLGLQRLVFAPSEQIRRVLAASSELADRKRSPATRRTGAVVPRLRDSVGKIGRSIFYRLDPRLRAELKRRTTRVDQRGEHISWPSATRLNLYSAHCTIQIEKARQLLGYMPKFNLARGMAETEPYVKSAFSKEIARCATAAAEAISLGPAGGRLP